jgi:hypothetical protein
MPVGWKGRLVMVALITTIGLIGINLHGSLAGRLVEGALFVTSIVVLAITGTVPEAEPRTDRAPGADADR